MLLIRPPHSLYFHNLVFDSPTRWRALRAEAATVRRAGRSAPTRGPIKCNGMKFRWESSGIGWYRGLSRVIFAEESAGHRSWCNQARLDYEMIPRWNLQIISWKANWKLAKISKSHCMSSEVSFVTSAGISPGTTNQTLAKRGQHYRLLKKLF